jgi:acetyl esterase/lipase
MRITDWSDAYANSAYVPQAAALIADWPARSAALRAIWPPEVRSYGPLPRQTVDLYRPEGAPKGLIVIVHGGYWQMLSGADFGFMAEGALARGYAVALPSYSLAPEARIAQITTEIALAIADAAQAVTGPIHLTGHSAGGHLVARMACTGVLPSAVAQRLVHVLSISGVHDLRPLRRTEMNEVLRIDAAEAAAESPALLSPIEGLRVTSAVGAAERPEFLRQSALLANIWLGLGADTAEIFLPGRHHFDVVEDMARADGPLLEALLA